MNGSLGGLSRQEVKRLIKTAYLEVATRGTTVRRINAAQARRSLNG